VGALKNWVKYWAMQAENLEALSGAKNMQVQEDFFRLSSGQKAFLGIGILESGALALSAVK
jgi:RAB protein geranylgeranyltransferase component A